MSKHAPGPWRLVISDKSWQKKYQVDDSFGACVVACDDITDENAEANARLIAAAPELLEACIGLCSDGLTGEQFAARLSFAKSAIAKARGEV